MRACVRACVRECVCTCVGEKNCCASTVRACVCACVQKLCVRACVHAPESKSQFFSRTHYSSMHHDVGKYYVGGGGAHRGFGVISFIIIVMAV